MNKTSIEWTHFSANPLKMRMPDGSLVNACQKISPGCQHCYAENYVRRFWKKAWGPFPGYTAALLKIGTPHLVESELEAVLRQSQRIAAGKANPEVNRVFWSDMTDEYLDFWPDEFRDKIWAVRVLTRNLIHQILTKRPHRMKSYLDGRSLYSLGLHNRLELAADALQPGCGHPSFGGKHILPKPPFDNVWLGCSVEDRKRLPRIEYLRQTPAAVRFLSLEPLIEDLGQIDLKGIGWVIVGGESGGGARPMPIQAARSLRDQCVAAGVSFFFKQWGGWLEVETARNIIGEDDPRVSDSQRRKGGMAELTLIGDDRYVRVGKGDAGRMLDGRTWDEYPATEAVIA